MGSVLKGNKMNGRRVWTLLLVMMALTLLGCGARAPTPAGVFDGEGARLEAPEAPAIEREIAVADASESLPGIAAIERKIIYNVSLQLIVQDTAASLEQIRLLTEEMGGFVAASNMWRDQDQQRASLTVRVPVETLDSALAKFRALAVDVESQSVGSQDVTEEYVDLEARLKNEQRTERELQELLETRSEMGKTSDILEVHRELSLVRSQIEQIQGRMKYLENLSAMATIEISLVPDALVQPVVVGGWQPQGTARDAVRLLLQALQFLADAAIVFSLLILPVALIIALPIVLLVLLVRAIWRRRKQRKQAKAESLGVS